MFSPKIEIINHFDELINGVDVDIDECLQNYNENQVIGENECFQFKKRNIYYNEIYWFDFSLLLKSSNDNIEETEDLWSESTKVVDYLKQIRMRTIEEFRKEQKDWVENTSKFNHLKVAISDEKQKDELKSQLFADKFYFQVKITKPEFKKWYFNLFTFVTDFYMSPCDITFLE